MFKRIRILTTALEDTVQGEERRGRKSLTRMHDIKRGCYKKRKEEAGTGVIRENNGERELTEKKRCRPIIHL